MQKVKILYFVDRLLMGGIQSLLINWITNFDLTKFQFDFLVLDDGYQYELEDKIQKLGCNVYKLNGVWIKKPFDYIKYSKKVDDFFKNHNDYNVVHLHSSSKNYIVLKYAKKYKIPIRISHAHSIDFQSDNFFKNIIGNFFKIPLRKYSTYYLACSKSAGLWLYGNRIVNSNKFKIIHNSINYERFKYNEDTRVRIRNLLKIKNDELVVGHIGRFAKEKNHSFLIDIFNELLRMNEKSRLILIGDGIQKPQIVQKVKSLNIEEKVIFAGFRNDVHELLQAIDVLIMPSLYEGLPVVGIEAQASGIPCFMSDTISREVKIARNVYFMSLKDKASDWAAAILKADLSRRDNEQLIQKSGYFLSDTIRVLENIYQGEYK